MEILELIDTLEELVIQARRLPVGGNLVVDRKRMLDVIDQMRLAVPADLRQAQHLLEVREHERARRIEESSVFREAQERGQQLLMDSEARARQVIAEADATAAAHMSEAAEAASKQLDDADHYALEVLRRLDHQMQAFLDSIRVSINSLEEKR
jgi:F0F1-type ATP synthase membrane subunit b/b'